MSEKISKKIICRDIEGNEYEVDSSELKSFRPSVYGILIKDGKILLSPQWDGYDFPGGGIDLHETVREGLLREVWEETGLMVEPQKLVACETSFFYIPPKMKRPTNSILIYYTIKWVSGELSTANFDEFEKNYAKMPEWIDLGKVQTLKFLNPVDSVAVIRKATESLRNTK